ncbi:MAG TPA: hypothetical protein VNB64_06710, partial [Solirubrobacteraceae bacterium]|nr:hypothetical protein [Solirubrobacteraceae bacterium]
MSAADPRIVLTLSGAKAKRGVELDGLEGFIDHFRRALREFERTISARAHEVGRMGPPGERSRVATGFRLVDFKTGSGVAQLEPLELDHPDGTLVRDEPRSSETLRLLVEAVRERRPMSPRVVDALEGARKALGGDGSFGIAFSSQDEEPFYIDEEQIQRLHAAASFDSEPRDVVVSGKLHLIEVEPPGKVEIRAADGVNWSCTYAEDMKATVLRCVDTVVRAHGVGVRTAHGRGTMELKGVEPLPKFEQTPLFTRAPI